MAIEYHPLVRRDLQEVIEHYELASDEAPRRFAESFRLAVERITVVKHEKRHPSFGMRRRLAEKPCAKCGLAKRLMAKR